jgi:hypothetical protein
MKSDYFKNSGEKMFSFFTSLQKDPPRKFLGIISFGSDRILGFRGFIVHTLPPDASNFKPLPVEWRKRDSLLSKNKKYLDLAL